MTDPIKTEPPKGLALFVRKLRPSSPRMGKPHVFAKRCADHGLLWVALAAIWHDVKKGRPRELVMNTPEIVADYSQALSEVGVNPHVWGYPWYDRIALFTDTLAAYLNPFIVGILLDPELGLKNHLLASQELFRRSRALNPYLLLGLSSYGLPRGHRTFPFGAFADADSLGNIDVECDYGCPQLYDLEERLILQGLAAYARLGFDHVVPAYGTYRHILEDGRKKAISFTADELERHLRNFTESHVPIPAAIGWAENFMTPALWDVLARWAVIFERGGTMQGADED